jgi:site-specific recombinase XerD
MVTLGNWRERMSEDMRLCDFRPRTQSGYLLAVRLFLERLGREPESLTDDDVRAYFLYLREDKKLAPSSINIAVCALRFFFIRTLQRDWQVFDLLRVHKPQRLPVVLSTGEVRAVLQAVRHPVRRMALTSIYALGLRLNEALPLASEDIDSQRLMVWLRDAKGAKDRGVPLPRRAAPLLEARAPAVGEQVSIRARKWACATAPHDAAEDLHGCVPGHRTAEARHDPHSAP